MWNIAPIYDVLLAVYEAVKAEEPHQIRENLIKVGLKLWDMIDPAPEVDLDDRIVKALLSWIVDRILEEM